jgi:hypothetical protein
MKHAAIVMVTVLAASACGPSAAELGAARATLYRVAPDQLVQLCVDAASEEYTIGPFAPDRRSFATLPRFYSPTGDLESAGAEGAYVWVPGTFQLSFIVRLVQAQADTWAVQVEPVTFQQIPGSPKPRALGPDDPYLPGWVHGRVDALVYRIYEHAKPYAIAGARR